MAIPEPEGKRKSDLSGFLTKTTFFVNMAPMKVKRVSKKNKKSWRKHVDINDVDEFLEDVRLEERLGKKFSERKDDDLFQIDTIGQPDERSKSKILCNLKQGAGEKKSLRLKQKETPKCYALLEARSAVSDPVTKRNRVKTREEKRHPAVRKILQHRLENGILSAKEKQAQENRKRREIERQKKPKLGEFNHDVWSETNNDRDLNGCAYWLTNDTIRHTLHNTGKKKKLMPKAIREKTSLLPAVEPPHPGVSYNPSLKHHREVLQSVVEKEMKLVKEDEHLERVTTQMFSKVKRDVADKEWLTEMSAGLSQDKEDPEVEGDYSTVNPPAKNKKKTLQKRRKLREARELKQKLKEQKVEKRKVSDIYKLRKFNQVIESKEAKLLKLAEKRQRLKEKKSFSTKILSQTKFQEPELDFTMTGDLKGNLRGLKPEGNLLLDRYKSLQKRNILEPALKRRVKKMKMKRFERASTKMGWEPKGY